jgi:hypothetical protein
LPSEDAEEEEIASRVEGSTVDLATLPPGFFHDLFVESEKTCKLEVTFTPTEGEQVNPVRDLIWSIAFEDDQAKDTCARELAYRLAEATDRRSLRGLFVVIAGRRTQYRRVVLWKFPADESLQARVSQEGMTIELIEDAFTGSADYFKAALFEGTSAADAFWRGGVEDRQSSGLREASDMWVVHFLQTRSALTDIHGSRVLAKVLKETGKKMSSLEDKQNVVAAARVIKGQLGRTMSLREISEWYLSEEPRRTFLSISGVSEIADTRFSLQEGILKRYLKTKTVEIDGAYTVSGPLEEFDDRVNIDRSDPSGTVTVTLEGEETSQSVK